MTVDEWKTRIAESDAWQYHFGSDESPVRIAALNSRTVDICNAIRDIISGRPLRLFVLGPPGAGKALFLSALFAGADEAEISVRSVSATTDTSSLARELAQGEISLLAVSRLDLLTPSMRSAIVEHRGRCANGIVVTAESIGASSASSLVEDLDVVMTVPPLERRDADVLAIGQMLWPDVCGTDSDLLSNCLDEAVENLCEGPYPDGVASLRTTLGHLANTLIVSGVLQGGDFRRAVDARDIGDAVLSSYRSHYTAPESVSPAAVVIVEGSTDVTLLEAAARVAERERGWRLLDGCEVRAAGEKRQGGAGAVWRRLIELSGSVESIGLFDNDDVGRRECAQARKLGLQVEVLPPEFDRLRLPDDQRVLEIEDLLSLQILDGFYITRSDLEPEEIRWRSGGGGAWRIVPKGLDKESLSIWAATEMQVTDCERLIYMLVVLRKRLGLSLPRSDLDEWRRDLLTEEGMIPTATALRIAGPEDR